MHHKYIILGAGCAGLSLCWYLLEAGVRDPILILERKTGFANDRTWCFWDTEPTPFTHLATHRWPAWEVRRDHDAKAVRATAPATPYVRLRADDFYQTVLARIRVHPNVTIQLGVQVTDSCHDDGAPGVCVATSAGVFRGDMLFDGLALSSPRYPAPHAGDVTFLQQFFGQFIRTPSDVFDTGTVTLMDFGGGTVAGKSRSAEVSFMYLLPLSPREALVERTVLRASGCGAINHPARAANAALNRCEISVYLGERYGLSDFQVLREEHGLIPMTNRPFSSQGSRPVYPIGLAGGAARPSSGYAFLRIQRNCRALALALVHGGGKMPRPSVTQNRTAFLDRIFLRAMYQNPVSVPGYFERLFSRVAPDRLVRLLSDSASLLDCAAVVRALPPADFIRAAVCEMHSAGTGTGCTGRPF